MTITLMFIFQSSQIFFKSLNYSFIPFGRSILIFIYFLAAQTSASQAGPQFKTVPSNGMKE